MTSDTTNPAVVSVPYGDVRDETVVTFRNAVDPTQFKICKQETSADAALSGGPFDFSWKFVDLVTADFDGGYDGTSLTVASATATDPTGLVCSLTFLVWRQMATATRATAPSLPLGPPPSRSWSAMTCPRMWSSPLVRASASFPSPTAAQAPQVTAANPTSLNGS